VAALVALIGAAVFIRLSRFGPVLLIGLVAVLFVSLMLLTLGVKEAGWGALVITPLIVSRCFRTAVLAATADPASASGLAPAPASKRKRVALLSGLCWIRTPSVARGRLWRLPRS
jgi:flagellar biosynthesis protein FliQ